MIKYIILDFGKVLNYPTTGHWFITPLFLKLIDYDKVDKDLLNEKFKEYYYITQRKVINLEEEYRMIYEYYDKVLSEINYLSYNEEISKALAYNFTYENDKYKFYDNIVDELKKLKEKYKLILLSDNWPCVIRIMKDIGIYDLFEKVYVSSIYGIEKSDKDFFDYPIKDFNIKNGEAIFIDDKENNLDIAKEKGLDVRLMDRENKVIDSKYKIIHNLYCL